MRRKSSLSPLGESELELLQLLWECGEGSVAEIHNLILEKRPLAYTTVMSQLRKLADKGYLKFKQVGSAYIYREARTPEQVRYSILSDILEKVFSGSPVTLVESLLQNNPLSSDEYARVKRMVVELELKQQEMGGRAW